MILSKAQIEIAFAWGAPREVRTRVGPRILRKARDIPEHLAFWQANQAQLSAMGVSYGLKWQSLSEMEFCWWQEVAPRIIQQRNQSEEASRATDAAIVVPAPEGLEYLPYQKGGIAWMRDRKASFLADEMGLGKTIQIIGTVNLIQQIQNILVLSPRNVRGTWFKELRKWLVRPFHIEAVTADWKASEVKFAMERHLGLGSRTEITAGSIFLLNFDIAHKHETTLLNFFWDLVVVDECHKLKNPKARRTQTIYGYRPTKEEREKGVKPFSGVHGRRKVVMSGSPLPNRVGELWPHLRYLNPVTFNNEFLFKRRYSGGQNSEELQELLRTTVMIRRLKSQVLKDLPAKRRQIIPLPAETDAMKEVVRRGDEIGRRWEEGLAELEAKVILAKAEANVDAYEAAINALEKAQGIAFEEMSIIRHETGLAKIPSAIQFIEDKLEETEKVIVLAYHRDVIERLEKAFSGVGALKIYGGMKESDVNRAVHLFQNDPDYRVIFLQIISAVGYTLTAASNVVAVEQDWVPANMNQAEDRAHRIGQLDSVMVYNLVIEGSMDVMLVEALLEKQQLIDAVLDKQKPKASELALEPMTQHSVRKIRVTREQLQEAALTITPTQGLAIHKALKFIAGQCNGAQTWDALGFSKVDAIVGHSLATTMFLTPNQAALGRRLVRKYRRQLPEEMIGEALGKEESK